MKTKENFGNIISEARRKKKLTQLELAKLVNVTDKAISNWETDKNIPDIDTIKKLEKILNISLIEQEINNKEIAKRNLLAIISVLAIVLLFLTSIYFLNNFNKVKIYKITLDCETFKINNSYLTITNNEVILNISELEKVDALYQEEYTITLYYKDRDSIHTIITKNDYHTLSLNENKNNYHFLSKEFLKNIDNIYINIKYKDYDEKEYEEDVKLNISKIFQNNKLIYKKEKNKKDKYTNLRIILKNNDYKEVDYNIYEKSLKNETFRYNIESNKLYYKRAEKNTSIYASFNIYGYSNEMNYTVYKDKRISEKYDFSDDNQSITSKTYYFEIYSILTKEASKLLED